MLLEKEVNLKTVFANDLRLFEVVRTDGRTERVFCLSK